jgi:intracellular sulfur oxidation DsrE/DsrF family protein
MSGRRPQGDEQRANMTDLAVVGRHFVARKEDFDWDAFAAAIDVAAPVRHVWQAFAFRPQVFNNLKNVMNGLQFGYGYDPKDVHLVFAPHGPASAYNYTDYIWKKYRIGDAMDLRDATGKRVESNVFLTPKAGITGSQDLDDEMGAYQDTSIQRLQERGVTFLSCATALQEQARIVHNAGFAPSGTSVDEIATDMLEHLIPGAVLVPSMVATVIVLQRRYGYTYLTLDT